MGSKRPESSVRSPASGVRRRRALSSRQNPAIRRAWPVQLRDQAPGGCRRLLATSRQRPIPALRSALRASLSSARGGVAHRPPSAGWPGALKARDVPAQAQDGLSVERSPAASLGRGNAKKESALKGRRRTETCATRSWGIVMNLPPRSLRSFRAPSPILCTTSPVPGGNR